MPLTTAGRNFLAQSIIDDSPTPFDNSNAYIGVGDDSTSFSAGQTDLVASSNKLRRAMEATYPQRATNVLTFRSLFATGDANYDWNEWGLFNGSSGDTMLNRLVVVLGSKTSAAAWLLTVDLTVQIGS